MTTAISSAVFICVFLMTVGVYWLLTDGKNKQKQSLLARLNPQAKNFSSSSFISQSKISRTLESWFIKNIGCAKMRSLLEESGMGRSAGEMLLISLFLGGSGIVLATVTMYDIFAALMGTCAGISLPWWYVFYRRNRRETALVNQLPNAVDMISRGLRSGQNLDESLREVGDNFPDPIGGEIKRVYDEMEMGLPFEAAFRKFESRFHRISDVKIICSALVIQRETGGNLTTILDSISYTIRERFHLRQQIKTLTAEGRSSALILGSLPIAFGLLVWILKPDYASYFFTDQSGKNMLLCAILLEVTGFACMRRMSRVEA